MSFGSAIANMINTLKLNSRPKRDPFSKHMNVYRDETRIDVDSIEDSMDFRKNRMNISMKRSYLIWMVILIITFFFVISFPYL